MSSLDCFLGSGFFRLAAFAERAFESGKKRPLASTPAIHVTYIADLAT